MKTTVVTSCLVCLTIFVAAQDPEFPKNEFIMHLRLHNGMVTTFHSSPDLYVGGLQLIPQWTVVENHLRIGAVAGGFYAAKKLQALAGPTISLKLKTFSLNNMGSGGNINLSLDHLWGTEQQRLLGGSVNVDIFNLIVPGISVHRDYHLNNWWIQGTIAFRISKLKKIPHP
jgi:hypothetical protein